jgi:hypothetical protein
MKLNHIQRQWICLFGLIISIISLFFLHFLLGFISLLFGIYAILTLERIIGWSTIVVGLLGILLTII